MWNAEGRLSTLPGVVSPFQFQVQTPKISGWAESVNLTRVLRTVLVVTILFGLFMAQPAAAQASNPVCQDESGTLTNMIEGFTQLTVALGIIGVVVVWQADELAEMFTLNHEQKKRLKAHKKSALKSAVVLVVIGPLFTIAGSTMGLPIAQCVDLIPF